MARVQEEHGPEVAADRPRARALRRAAPRGRVRWWGLVLAAAAACGPADPGAPGRFSAVPPAAHDRFSAVPGAVPGRFSAGSAAAPDWFVAGSAPAGAADRVSAGPPAAAPGRVSAAPRRAAGGGGPAGQAPAAPPSARATTPGGTGGVNAPETLGKPYLVLVSFDGFRHDYLARYDTPSFDRVAALGVAAEALVPVYPSLTFPAHYSIATGLHPERHGLVGNRFHDPARGAEYSYRDPAAVEDGS